MCYDDFFRAAPHKPIFTKQERAERLNVAALLLETDTWAGIAGGITIVDAKYFENINTDAQINFTGKNNLQQIRINIHSWNEMISLHPNR